MADTTNDQSDQSGRDGQTPAPVSGGGGAGRMTGTTDPATAPEPPKPPLVPPTPATASGTVAAAAGPDDGFWTTRRCAWLVGAALSVVWLIAFAVFMTQWPGLEQAFQAPDEPWNQANVLAAQPVINKLTLLTDPSFLALLAASGALGATLHAMTSFTGFLGNGQFSRTWTLWYLTRAPIGATMALLFMPMVGAGFIPDNSNPGDGGLVFFMVSLGILVGMFSKDATDKLTDVFSAILTSKRDVERAGKMTIPTPRLTAIRPATLTAGTSERELTISGTDFLPTCAALVNGTPRRCQVNGTTSLTLWLEPEDVAQAGTLSIVARNPDGGRPVDSAPLTVAVVA